MATLIAIQQPQLFNGVVFSAPAILPAVGFILVCTSAFTSYAVVHCNGLYVVAWFNSCNCCHCPTITS